MSHDRYIPSLPELKEGEKSVSKRILQEEVRKLWEAIHVLEGRSGPINLLDSVTVHGNLTATGELTGTTANLNNTFIMSERGFDSNLSYVPEPAPQGQGRIYLDMVLDRLRVSENFRNYQDLVMFEHCRIYSAVTQSIADSTDTTLSFDTIRSDTDTMFDLAGQPTRITFNTAGVYSVGAAIRFVGNATGLRRAQIALNGSATNSICGHTETFATNAVNAKLNPNCDWEFSVGDYIEVVVRQTSGGPLNVNNTVSDSCEFWATRVQ